MARNADPPDPAATALLVEVTQVRFAVDDGDFAVLGAVTDDGDEVTLTGPLGHVGTGEALEVGGRFRRHERHGWQFHVDRLKLREPVSSQGLITYLQSVKHVGKRGAAWLVEAWGEEVLATVDQDPASRLGEVPGIGRSKLGAAVRSWESQREQRALRLFLEEHGVPAAAAGRVVRNLEGLSVADLQADPYALTEIDGIGFATADALALALGLPRDSPERLQAGILHVLTEAESDGHCYLPREELAERSRRLLGTDATPQVEALALSGRVVPEADGVASALMHNTERKLARAVRGLLDAEPAFSVVEPDRAASKGFSPTDAQWSVVESVLAGRLTILTGGPGTGKSASMRALVDVLRAAKRSVRLCAPTGKAARRLAELTGAEATTIHRLLEWAPGEGFTREAARPIDGADVLVVDEASMLGVGLATALLDAVGPRTHLLLVGDPDQLAPVGPGRVLEDLIDSGAVPVIALTEIFRQAARSLIVRAAHAVNAGQRPPTQAGEGDLRDFFLIARDDVQRTFLEVCDLAAERLPRHYGVAPHEVQVLAPMHKGPLGIDAFNDALRARLNPDGEAIPGTPFRVGDRVLQTRNDHELELMNGELGVLVAHDRGPDGDEDDEEPGRGAAGGGRTAAATSGGRPGGRGSVRGPTVLLAADDGRRLRVPVRATETLRLAHAVSVHKAQGSQMPVVVMPLFRGHQLMLTRNLVYTALTRATTAAVLAGDPAALDLALTRRDAHRRFTRLAGLVVR